MKTKYLLIALFFCSQIQAQTIDPHFSQFMLNKLVFNPAYAGYYGSPHFAVFHRSQWVGFEGAPVTQTISADLPLPSKKIALGAHFINDGIGIQRNFTFITSYAYKIIMDKGSFTMGLNAGVRQFGLDPTQISAKDKNDPNLQSIQSPFVPDFGLGFVYKDASDRFHVGVSALHLWEFDIIYNVKGLGNAKVARMFFANGGYKYKISQNLSFLPSGILKFDFRSPAQFDFNFTLLYKEMVWFGSTYRTSDAISFMTGLNIDKLNIGNFKEKFKIGYAFDWTVSRLPTYNSGGSHEIFITFDYSVPDEEHKAKFKKIE